MATVLVFGVLAATAAVAHSEAPFINWQYYPPWTPIMTGRQTRRVRLHENFPPGIPTRLTPSGRSTITRMAVEDVRTGDESRTIRRVTIPENVFPLGENRQHSSNFVEPFQNKIRTSGKAREGSNDRNIAKQDHSKGSSVPMSLIASKDKENVANQQLQLLAAALNSPKATEAEDGLLPRVFIAPSNIAPPPGYIKIPLVPQDQMKNKDKKLPGTFLTHSSQSDLPEGYVKLSLPVSFTPPSSEIEIPMIKNTGTVKSQKEERPSNTVPVKNEHKVIISNEQNNIPLPLQRNAENDIETHIHATESELIRDIKFRPLPASVSQKEIADMMKQSQRGTGPNDSRFLFNNKRKLNPNLSKEISSHITESQRGADPQDTFLFNDKEEVQSAQRAEVNNIVPENPTPIIQDKEINPFKEVRASLESQNPKIKSGPKNFQFMSFGSNDALRKKIPEIGAPINVPVSGKEQVIMGTGRLSSKMRVSTSVFEQPEQEPISFTVLSEPTGPIQHNPENTNEFESQFRPDEELNIVNNDAQNHFKIRNDNKMEPVLHKPLATPENSHVFEQEFIASLPESSKSEQFVPVVVPEGQAKRLFQSTNSLERVELHEDSPSFLSIPSVNPDIPQNIQEVDVPQFIQSENIPKPEPAFDDKESLQNNEKNDVLDINNEIIQQTSTAYSKKTPSKGSLEKLTEITPDSLMPVKLEENVKSFDEFDATNFLNSDPTIRTPLITSGITTESEVLIGDGLFETTIHPNNDVDSNKATNIFSKSNLMPSKILAEEEILNTEELENDLTTNLPASVNLELSETTTKSTVKVTLPIISSNLPSTTTRPEKTTLFPPFSSIRRRQRLNRNQSGNLSTTRRRPSSVFGRRLRPRIRNQNSLTTNGSSFQRTTSPPVAIKPKLNISNRIRSRTRGRTENNIEKAEPSSTSFKKEHKTEEAPLFINSRRRPIDKERLKALRKLRDEGKLKRRPEARRIPQWLRDRRRRLREQFAEKNDSRNNEVIHDPIGAESARVSFIEAPDNTIPLVEANDKTKMMNNASNTETPIINTEKILIQTTEESIFSTSNPTDATTLEDSDNIKVSKQGGFITAEAPSTTEVPEINGEYVNFDQNNTTEQLDLFTDYEDHNGGFEDNIKNFESFEHQLEFGESETYFVYEPLVVAAAPPSDLDRMGKMIPAIVPDYTDLDTTTTTPHSLRTIEDGFRMAEETKIKSPATDPSPYIEDFSTSTTETEESTTMLNTEAPTAPTAATNTSTSTELRSDVFTTETVLQTTTTKPEPFIVTGVPIMDEPQVNPEKSIQINAVARKNSNIIGESTVLEIRSTEPKVCFPNGKCILVSPYTNQSSGNINVFL